jgi:hypothetical protein
VADALKKQGHWKDDYGNKAGYIPGGEGSSRAVHAKQGTSQ